MRLRPVAELKPALLHLSHVQPQLYSRVSCRIRAFRLLQVSFTALDAAPLPTWQRHQSKRRQSELQDPLRTSFCSPKAEITLKNVQIIMDEVANQKRLLRIVSIIAGVNPNANSTTPSVPRLRAQKLKKHVSP
jgi:hypothetical protein